MLRFELLALARGKDQNGRTPRRGGAGQRRTGHSACWLLWVSFSLLAASMPASAQFTVTATGFQPFAIQPGSSSSSLVTVTAGTGFSGTVDLSCSVVSTTGATSGIPVCQVTPGTVTPSAQASMTVSGLTSTGGAAAAGTYTVTVTGTQASTNSSQSENITILTAAPGFTITVQTPVQPNSVHAGSGATATIDVNPLPGYSGTITLSCATVTPLVDLPPYCSFSPQGFNVNQTAFPVTLTINTYGPINTGQTWRTRTVYALWLPLPLLAFVGAGVALGGKRTWRAWSLLGLLMLGGMMLLVPGCGTNTGNTTTNPTGNTPKNTYTFTLLGVDNHGTIATNTTGTNSPSVTLTVN